jgi:hypothetical protein
MTVYIIAHRPKPSLTRETQKVTQSVFKVVPGGYKQDAVPLVRPCPRSSG